MTNEETVIHNIRLLMENRGWSLRTLANRADMSPANLSKIMKGTVKLSIPAAIKIAEALSADIQTDIFKGIITKSDEPESDDKINIGIMSINNRRFTYITSLKGELLGTSVLEGGLDLADSSEELCKLIMSAIKEALHNNTQKKSFILSRANLKLVTQSYEFEAKRRQFWKFMNKHFGSVMLLPDWVITLLAAFDGSEGITLVTDKGVSLTYLYNNQLKKIGGWKYPVYDLGGENWLGVETIKHTIEAAEGFIPMSDLAHNVLSRFDGKLERITECCLQSGNPDIYLLFAEILLRSYFTEDNAAKEIIYKGFKEIERSVILADKKIGKQLNITLNGSLARIYKPFLDVSRLIEPIEEMKKVKLLAEITEEHLRDHGVFVEYH